MDNSSKYDFPWELVAESLTGSITVEGELQLQQWFSSDPENKKKYLQIQELWKNGMEDYMFYKMANENEAWKALHSKLVQEHPEQRETTDIQEHLIQRPKTLRNLIALAAVFVGVVGIGIWFMLAGNNKVIYETGLNEQKKVSLIDGSVITLQQRTKIEVPRGFNKSDRKIIMVSGEAYFDVVHITEKPCIVDMGITLIKDIGTSFTISKTEKKINVEVFSGKVAFVKLATKETREINAGSGITFDVQNESFGNIKTVESSGIGEHLLVFENTPLSEVIVSIQKVYNKKIILSDSIAGKKFTAQLDGMPYNNVIMVICKSLGLEYTINDSVYILKARTGEQP